MSIEQSIREEQSVKHSEVASSDEVVSKGAPPVVKQIDVVALKIDKVNYVDCDPYNSTGQFVTDEIQKQFRD